MLAKDNSRIYNIFQAGIFHSVFTEQTNLFQRSYHYKVIRLLVVE